MKHVKLLRKAKGIYFWKKKAKNRLRKAAEIGVDSPFKNCDF